MLFSSLSHAVTATFTFFFFLLSLRATPATGFMREKFLKIRLWSRSFGAAYVIPLLVTEKYMTPSVGLPAQMVV